MREGGEKVVSVFVYFPFKVQVKWTRWCSTGSLSLPLPLSLSLSLSLSLYLSPNEIYKGNEKVILPLLWQFIRHFSDDSERGERGEKENMQVVFQWAKGRERERKRERERERE